MDVQGYEMHVLRGATQSLASVYLIEAELSLVSIYERQPLYREVIDALDALNFSLVSLDPGFCDPRSGRVLQFDGIFARREA
jgi:hypothetical protein